MKAKKLYICVILLSFLLAVLLYANKQVFWAVFTMTSGLSFARFAIQEHKKSKG
jgi:hypothetical protein